MLDCRSCGASVVPGARFCFQCGTPLGRSTEEAAESSAERRVVTVLFGDLSDFTAWAEDLDPERVGGVTDRVLALLAGTVTKYGGHVDKLTGDGIMAIFGAPIAHEDDAERAVRAADEMQQAVAKLVAEETGGGQRLGLRVGLNTGEVLAGMQAALAYTVVGDAVNTASRLSDVARVGGVLAGRDTAAATLEIASWRALAPLRLKGKRDPVPAYELVALRRRGVGRLGVGDEAPLIGREAELGALVGRMSDVADRGRPASVLLTGEAGIGKTRLARELAVAAAERAGTRVLTGRCAPYGEGRDLVPFVEMVRTACAIAEDDDAETARERVRRTVSRVEHPTYGGWSSSHLTERLLAVLGLADQSPAFARDAATPGDGTRDGDEVVGALVSLFNGLARQGLLVLVLDDLHWAGRGLLDVAVDVANRLTGSVLIVAVGRSDLMSEHAEWSAALPDPVLLPVAPLEPPAAERLLRAYLGGADLDTNVAQLVLDRAQGNPFFLAELLHLLVDRGVLHRDDGGWHVNGSLPADVLPAGVQAVLAARIDGLAPGPKAALRDAAVVGTTFWSGAVAAASAVSIDVAEARLADLLGREIVHQDGTGGYAFAHTLTREVAYASLPKGERARRHAAVAWWAVDGLPGSPAEVDPFVASHAEQATVLASEMQLPLTDAAWRASALGYQALVRLGRAALARDENVHAEDLLGRALLLATAMPDEDVVAARVAHAQALAGLHRLADAEHEATTGLDAADPGVRALAHVVLGDVRRKQSDDDAATAEFVTALALASEAGSNLIAGEAIRQLGLLDYFAGRLRASEERFSQALDLAERVGDRRGQGWALQHLAWSATTRGDYALADQTLARASEIFTSVEDTGGLGWCAGTSAFVLMLQGRLRAAREIAAAVRPNAEAVFDRFGTAACLTIEAMAAAELGEIGVAREQATRAEELFRELDDWWGVALALVAQGMAERGAGDIAKAEELLRETVRVSERGHHATTLLLAQLAIGWVRYDARDLDGAEEAADRALILADELGVERHAQVAAQVLLALIQRRRGEPESAADILATITAEAEPSLFFPARQALAHYAGTLLDAGRAEDALAVAERATQVPAEDIRSQVIALRAVGNALAAVGRRAEAEDKLREALAVANSTEQVAERAATEDALNEVLARTA